MVHQEIEAFAFPIVSHIVDDLRRQQPVVIVGSWPAKQIADAWAKAGNAAPTLVANDIDVFYSNDDENTIEVTEGKPLGVDFSSIQYHQLTLPETGEEYTINTVGARNLSWRTLLDNNDVDATAVAIEAHRDWGTGDIHMEFHVSPAFWGFLLSSTSDDDFTIRPSNPSKAYNVQTIVRIAYKAWQMGLRFDAGTIDPTVGEISLSNLEKIKAMEHWPSNPFRNLELRAVDGGSYWNAYRFVSKT